MTDLGAAALASAPWDMPLLVGNTRAARNAAFDARAGWLVNRLVRDLTPLATFQAAGIVGNLGGESMLDPDLNEVAPLVPGSRGGIAWAQWTGSARRVPFEKWAAAHGLDIVSDDINAVDEDKASYGFLVHELMTTEASALRELRGTTTLEGATESFLRRFERPADPDRALPGRIAMARRALAAASRAPSLPLPPRDRAVAVAIVKALQTALIPWGYAGKIDGDPGRQTLAAIAEFRRA